MGVLSAPDPLWAPTFYTPSLHDRSDGPDISDFAKSLLKTSRGFKAGEPLCFTNWQRWLLDRVFERRADNGFLRYRRALIGVPRKQGKSLLGTSIALQHLLSGPAGAQVYSAACDRQQARIVFGEARQQVLNSPTLSRVIKVYRDALEVPSRNAVYRALSADASSAQGLGPSLVVADELHVWPSSPTNTRGDDLWEALVSGSGDRPESMVLAITTAGGNMDTLLGRLYEYGKRIARGEAEDNEFGFWWWQVNADDDPTDPAVWRRANPNLAEGLLDESDFQAAVKSAGTVGFARFQRLRLNQWLRMSGEDFIAPFQWKAARRDVGVLPGDTVTVGFDGSVSGDATGVVIQNVDTGCLTVAKVWEPDPNDPEWVVDRHEVNAVIEKVFETYKVVKLWADPSFYEPDVLEWSKRWKRRVERIPPTNHRIAPLAQQFIADLVSGVVGHDGDRSLERHVLNAVATESGSFRKEKKHSPRKVDLLACAVMANGARNAYLARPGARNGTVRILS
jgi:phage terminase large subunit-like protein